MPTYEFACPAGHRFDKFYRKISDAVATLPCPECGAEAARQLSGGAGLIFRGSGFYITDYGKDGKKSPAAPASSGEKSGASEKGATPAGKGEGSGASTGKGPDSSTGKGSDAKSPGGSGGSPGSSNSE